MSVLLKILTALTLLPSGIALVGCNSSDLATRVPVKGKVMVDGAPLREGRVIFYPVKGRQSTGVIQSDGTFALGGIQPDDGAELGESIITVEAASITTTGVVPRSREEENKGITGMEIVTPLVDLKYSDRTTTPLRFTVTEAGPNEPTLQVTAPKK